MQLCIGTQGFYFHNFEEKIRENHFCTVPANHNGILNVLTFCFGVGWSATVGLVLCIAPTGEMEERERRGGDVCNRIFIENTRYVALGGAPGGGPPNVTSPPASPPAGADAPPTATAGATPLPGGVSGGAASPAAPLAPAAS